MGKPVKVSDQNKAWNRKPQERQVDVRSVRRRFLIISEGTKTEPLYFKAIEKSLPLGTVQVVACGTGRSELSLVEVIADLRKDKEEELAVTFDEVWAVFDKDSFPESDFDNAIHSCAGQRKKYSVAWSNECFELWYLLHLKDQKTGLGRKTIYKALETALEIEGYEKLKGDAGRTVHEQMATHANQATAIARAKKLYGDWNNLEVKKRVPPSRQNPCSTVYQLVEKLLACRLPEKN
jgi:hypothetical protein